MRVLSWNIRNGGKKDRPGQLAAIRSARPDIVALQEVTRSAVDEYQRGLFQQGLVFAVNSFALAPRLHVLKGPRKYGQIIASRWPILKRGRAVFDVPWPERVLTAHIAVPRIGEVEIHNTHVPPGASNGWTKVDHLRGLWRRLARRSTRPRILCGDFNTPKNEFSDGTVETWGERDADWDASELLVLVGLRQHDLHDAYRSLHGYSRRGYSIVMAGNNRRRYDHIFASERLRPVSAEYLHRFRLAGLSDHAPLAVAFKARVR